jgi:hypothetical protein
MADETMADERSETSPESTIDHAGELANHRELK